MWTDHTPRIGLATAVSCCLHHALHLYSLRISNLLTKYHYSCVCNPVITSVVGLARPCVISTSKTVRPWTTVISLSWRHLAKRSRAVFLVHFDTTCLYMQSEASVHLRDQFSSAIHATCPLHTEPWAHLLLTTPHNWYIHLSFSSYAQNLRI